MTTEEIREEHAWYNIKWFEKMAPVYDLVEFLVRPLREKIVGLVKKDHARIIDVACGTGNQSLAFAKHGHTVVGVDLSPDMLRIAEKKSEDLDVKFIQQDASKLQMADDSFDVVTVSFGLHDMPEEVALLILDEMKRVLRPGGQIIIVDYATPITTLWQRVGNLIAKTWESKNYDHFRKVGLEYELEKAGMEVVTRETYLLKNIDIVECKLVS